MFTKNVTPSAPLTVARGSSQTSRLRRWSYLGVIVAGLIGLSMMILGMNRSAPFSIAYGSLNNFDCVNDTGVEAHGFDIELDDIRSTDITYTYDYNHYGVPKITEDLTDPAHPKVFVRYASAKKPDGTWAAYTAIPSGPISPTDGHQFTDPSVNFGGEHFGVGFYGSPTAVKYNWLVDDGSGNLVHGPPVNVSTPTFVYNPPVGAAPANVVAVIAVPPPPVQPPLQFGEATWVKSIKTTSHNPNKVKLQDLVSDDPGVAPPWANGEPDEVEVEWRLMQTEFGAPGGGVNGELQGGAEDLPGGDEIITRRYEFFKYLGPIDAESGEAMADAVASDGVHGVGSVTFNSYIDPITYEWVTETVDLSTVEVVGEFFGAQMSGFDAAPALGLIDNVQDGELNVPYPERRVVIPGSAPFLVSVTGNLPVGMTLDPVSGVLSGTPLVTGAFTFTVEASDFSGGSASHTYTLTIPGGNEGTYNVTTAASPLVGGTTIGGGTFNLGSEVTVVASANAGYYFDNWSEGGVHFNFTPSYTFVVSSSRDLVANFLLDSIAPDTVASLSGSLGNNGWYTGNVEVTLSATDGQSGVLGTFYQLDAGPTTTYQAPIMVLGDGAHVVDYWSRDKAQNVEPVKSSPVKIDGTAPTLSAVADKPALKPANRKMVSVTISGTITDGISGVDRNTGSFSVQDSYGLIQPSGTFLVAANGTFSFTVLLEAKLDKKAVVARVYTVNLHANDMAGNLGVGSVAVTVPTKK
jgi:hypothetical protein